MLMHELRLIADEFIPPGLPSKNIQPNDKVSLLLCGDFNSLPESGMYI
jgi:endonuclease/exonuclease/phosphatase family metal-dependent hydrolase